MFTNLKRLTGAGALALALSLTAVPMHAQYGPPPPPPGQGGPGGWDAPPPEMRAAMQQGYQDGVTGARKDVENRRRPNVNNRDEYRHPHVPRNVYHDYREAFREGYHRAVVNMGYGRPGPGPR